MSAEQKQSPSAPAQSASPGTPSVKWDDSKMQTTYANVVNVSSTREEMSIFFGTNQTWNIPADKKFDVQLTDRMVLNPFAAKRLSILLTTVLKEYETRFGVLNVEAKQEK